MASCWLILLNRWNTRKAFLCRRIDLQGLRPALPADPDDHEAPLLGAVPLMLGTGTGSEIRQPLGYAIVGGLAVSQELTLYTTPVNYIYFDKLQTWMSRRRGMQAAGEPAPHPQPAE
jgi:hypothetical protein